MNHIEMMQLAEAEAAKSVCKRAQVGAVVVCENGRIKTGFNHNNGKCCEDENGKTLPSVIHAEMAATGQHLSSLLWGNVMGFKVLYVTRQPCIDCAQMITQTGIKSVYYRDPDDKTDGLEWLKSAGVYVDSGWIAGQQPTVLERVQKTWADRWQE